MRWRHAAIAATTALALALPLTGRAASPPTGAAAPSRALEAPLEWPATLRREGYEIVVYAPQIDEWIDGRELVFRVALAITATVDATRRTLPESAYGVLRLRAQTAVDLDEGTVLLSGCSVEDLRFEPLVPELVEPISAAALEFFPAERVREVEVERIVAAMEQAAAPGAVRSVAVELDPPTIHFADEPARLVILVGPPFWVPVTGTGLEVAVNTNWDLFRDPRSGAVFLLDGDTWLTAPSLGAGAERWSAADELPEGLFRLPEQPDWDAVAATVPGRRGGRAPLVLVSEEPAELLTTDGAPRLEAIPETRLEWVRNTPDVLLRHADGGEWYYLVAGRWFRADSLEGPWSAATTSLPADFAAIPRAHSAAVVLSSVPGTPEAADAVALASVPRRATVDRRSLSIEVQFDGEPEFVPTGAPGVDYGINSASTVLRCDGAFYCCEGGVWFRSDEPVGRYQVADSVPRAVYAIPVESPVHNVTYVEVAKSTADTVTVQHTAGYTGEYISTGLVLLGAGALTWAALANADSVSFNYRVRLGPISATGRSMPVSYGAGARYVAARGAYTRAAGARYGPYGGVGRTAVWDASTQSFRRGPAVWGTAAPAAGLPAFDPVARRTGASAGGDPYRAWSAGVTSDSARLSRGASGGQAVTPGDASRDGSRAAAARARHGDLYAGQDGAVYRRGDDGTFQRAGGGAAARDAASQRATLQKAAAGRDRASVSVGRRGGGRR